MRHYQIDPHTNQIYITCPYNATVIDAIKTIPYRTWDPNNKRWITPLHTLEQTIETLRPFGFTEKKTKDITATPPNHTANFNTQIKRSQHLNTRDNTLTVSALAEQINTTIRSRFNAPLWLRCELSNINNARQNGHIYFDVIENKQQKTLRFSAVIWKNNIRAIQQKIKGHFELEDGIEVKLLVQINYYTARNQISLHVNDIDPTFTLGQLALQRQKIREQLASENLLGRNEKQPWPTLPIKIALLTSKTAEAKQDFLHQLELSQYAFQVDCYHVAVQGQQVETDLCKTLEHLKKHPNYDIVAIVRGGGAQTDLAWFDNFAIAKAVAILPTKVIIGIGHTRDQTILDEVATSAKTPTAAADLLIQRVEKQAQRLQQTQQKLRQLTHNTLAQHQQQHLNHILQLDQKTRHTFAQQKQRWYGQAKQILYQTQNRLKQRRHHHQQQHLSIENQIHNHNQKKRDKLDLAVEKIKNRTANQLEKYNLIQQNYQLRIQAHHPEHILKRGYVQLKHNDTIVRSLTQIQKGQTLTARLIDGKITLKMIDKQPGLIPENKAEKS